jgi:two-component system CheB/CheR fusion protein
LSQDSAITQEEKIDSKQSDATMEQYIVAVGASAGGLESIHEFFDNLTDSGNLSFVIIQHLSPDYKSLLVELVAKHTDMKVYEAVHDTEVKNSCIYVIPPKKLMTISGGRIQLSDKIPGDRGPNTAIDHFFHSLANDKGEKAIAIILSGTGTDGTRGAESVKAAGGIVIVQDPETAKFDGMPRSAISSGVADCVLPPDLMPGEISNHIQEVPDSIFRKGKVDEEVLEELYKLIYAETGCNFQQYKRPTILRRIARRMFHHNFKFINEYVEYLKEHKEECIQLNKEFLIGVTKFFRDPAAYEILKKTVLPALIDPKPEGEVFKLWVCACSTGEEVYSLAILIDEYIRRKNKLLDVKIFATDIDSDAIEKASKGFFTLTSDIDIPDRYLEQYFIKEEKGYSVVPHIRKQIVFAKHNVTSDPPFIKNDLVSCRNMLIYMNTALQKKVINTLHFSLNNGGFLFLGSSENITVKKESFEETDRKWKIYHKNHWEEPKALGTISNGDYPLYATNFKLSKSIVSQKISSKGLSEDFKESLIEDFKFAAVYIDNNYEVKEALGDYKKYISLPEHSLNLNLLKMVPADLGAVLGAGIRRAWKSHEKVHLSTVRIRDGNQTKLLHIVVKPGIKDSATPYTLITFGEAIADSVEHKAPPIISEELVDGDSEYITNLKFELKETRLNLQAAIEELETTNEELQSSNEELLSSNEELQSSNEELQSLNEELHTLNTEHQLKITELVELNDDLNNYFKSTDIGQIFLDSHLNIRKFNPAAVKLINLIETDIGRPFSNISTNIDNNTIASDIQQVIDTGVVVEKEVMLTSGKISLMRIYPYIRQDKRRDGVVLSFVDVTAIKDLNNIITGIFNSSQNATMALKAVRDEKHNIVDFRWLTANEATEGFYQMKRQDFIGKTILTVMPKVVEKGLFAKYLEVVQRDDAMRFEYPVQCEDKQGWWEISAVKMMDGLAVTIADITEKKVMEAKMAERTDELNNINQQLELTNHDLQQFASVASHDLKEPLRKIHMFSQMLKDRYLKEMEGASEYANRIINSSSRMTRLINDLLSFSRLSSVENMFESTNVNRLIDEVLSDLELAISDKGAQVIVGDFPVIDSIPGQLRQVFQNIISNALKFTQRNVKPIIKIEASRILDKKFNSVADKEGQYLRIKISDNGIGFDDQFRDKIFTLFQRLHTIQEYEGTGIGLAICKRIVDKHNGVITAQSKENVGTSFIIILPIKQHRN